MNIYFKVYSITLYLVLFLVIVQCILLHMKISNFRECLFIEVLPKCLKFLPKLLHKASQPTIPMWLQPITTIINYIELLLGAASKTEQSPLQINPLKSN